MKKIERILEKINFLKKYFSKYGEVRPNVKYNIDSYRITFQIFFKENLVNNDPFNKDIADKVYLEYITKEQVYNIGQQDKFILIYPKFVDVTDINLLWQRKEKLKRILK